MTKYQQELLSKFSDVILLMYEEAIKDESFDNILAELNPPMSLEDWFGEIRAIADRMETET